LIQSLRSQVDAFAITSLPKEIRFDDRTYVHRQTLEVMSTPSSVPICSGERLKELANINGLSLAIKEKRIVPQDGIYFPLGLLNLECAKFLHEKHNARLLYGDLASLFGIPVIADPHSKILAAVKFGLHAANLTDLKKLAPGQSSRARRYMGAASSLVSLRDVRHIFVDLPVLLLFEPDLEFVRGKDIIVPYSHPRMEEALAPYEPASIQSLFPENFKWLHPYLNYSVLDAALRLSNGVDAPLSLEAWEELLQTKTEVTQATKRYILGARPSTQVKVTQRVRKFTRRINAEREPDFAFVVHCLSYDHLFRAPVVGPLLKRAPPQWNPVIEKNIAKLPGIVYGRASGIVSRKTGRETTGILYGLFATPKIMREEPPEVTYEKIEKLCYHAAEQGAKIIGLGAYTKVVGDAGATINRNSPIPVTTGNSLSASATLWALYEAVKKMDLLVRDPESGRFDATACVIGATGSIGKVSAKLLSMDYKRLCLVAPRIERLLELKAEIESRSPGCEVTVSTNANEVAAGIDVLVTTTSAFDQKIVDVEQLKPGCVVCDCSRPLDFTLEDAIKRPDILIIESGEVILPGSGRQFNCDLGLPGNVVFACLGETALLSMEGLHEPFTLGREIEWSKVRRIDRLAREHGVELAAITGLHGLITDKEIALTRKLALERRRRVG
jgi:predicted amino acid dehydrogenase